MTYPIILAHGVCRFDIIWKDTLGIDDADDPKKDNLHYFKGIRTMLKEKGFEAYHANVGWAVGVDQRAKDLKKNILAVLNRSQAPKVNIIAHSMGGLDARHMIFNDRHTGKIHERVASITTISTPHEGSPFADWGTSHLPYVIPVAKKIGLDLAAIDDLKTAVCKAFNRNPEVIDFEKGLEDQIKFQTYAGKQHFWGVFDALKLPYTIIEKQEGENDGLVSVASACWREHYFQQTIHETDHLNELGWWDFAQFWDGESAAELLARIHTLYAGIAVELP